MSWSHNSTSVACDANAVAKVAPKCFKLVRTPVNSTTYDNWEDVLPHRDDVLLEGIDIFKDYLVVSERSDGLNQIRVKRWDAAADYYIEFPDPAYSAYVGANPDFDTQPIFRRYFSKTKPLSCQTVSLSYSQLVDIEPTPEFSH